MTRQEQIKTIREKCVAARQPIYKEMVDVSLRPIRLADVLLAIRTADQEDRERIPYKSYDDLIWEWECRKDDIEQQSDECISFIHSLLCV